MRDKRRERMHEAKHLICIFSLSPDPWSHMQKGGSSACLLFWERRCIRSLAMADRIMSASLLPSDV